MNRLTAGLTAATLLALLALLAPVAATAQSAPAGWPDHPIKLVVPFPAGGPTDIIARVVAQSMTDALGQPVVIDNRGGAGGVTGTDMVARSAPDGYTIALSSAGALSISPSLQRMPYQSTKDLAPITLVAKVPELLVVPASSSSKTLEDFIAAAKAKPGAFNFGSTGPGGMPHLAAELLKAKAGIDMVHVPYAGAAPAVTDLLGARTEMMFADIPVLLPHVQAGALRPLAVGSAKRVPMLPDVPTMAEKGLPAVEAENWYGIVAPAATPPAIIARLNAVIVAALRSPEVQQKLTPIGAILIGDTPEEFRSYILSEEKKWAEVVRLAGVKID
jgi:tripartite-type tricarboxylate transporter receptor subunit TctC